MDFLKHRGHRVVDRGDPAAYDYTAGTLTTNNAWHDLDLSSIIGKNAVGVLLAVVIKSPTINALVSFRKKGNSNIINIASQYIHIVNQLIVSEFFVSVVNNGTIQYKAWDVTWTNLDIVVKAYFV